MFNYEKLLEYDKIDLGELPMKALHGKTLRLLKNSYHIKDFIKKLKNEPEEFYLDIIKRYPSAIREIKKPTNRMCLEAVRRDGLTLKFVKNKTPEICLAAVKQNGIALLYIKNQTPEICLAAVKENGLALEYVKEQTPEICLEAVKQNGLAIKYVKNQALEICLEATENSPYSIDYIKDDLLRFLMYSFRDNKEITKEKILNGSLEDKCNIVIQYSPVMSWLVLKYSQSPKVIKDVLDIQPRYIIYVKNKKPEYCFQAIKKDPFVITLLDNPTDEMIMLALELEPDLFNYIDKEKIESKEIRLLYELKHE